MRHNTGDASRVRPASRWPHAPSEHGPAGRATRGLSDLTAALTFMEDGVHAVLFVNRKEACPEGQPRYLINQARASRFRATLMHDSNRRFFLSGVGRMFAVSPRDPKVFISYRRSDSRGHAGRLYDRLAAEFGEESVFIDVVDIAPGEPFPPKIEETIRSCNALVVIIGPRWLPPSEVVQTEIATALGGGISVIPVLVDDARMPTRQDLPAGVEKLYTLHAIELSDSRWKYDTERLIRALRERPRPHTLRHSFSAYARAALATWRGRTAVAALLLLTAVAFYFTANRGPRDFDDCIRQRLPKVPQDRLHNVAVEAGTDYTLAIKGQPNEGPFVLRFTEDRLPIGALSVSFFPDETSDGGSFKVGDVFEPPCREVVDYSNETTPGKDKHLPGDWNWLKIRFGERYYWLRPGYDKYKDEVSVYFTGTAPALTKNTN